jgi:hypothetical protein
VLIGESEAMLRSARRANFIWRRTM